MAIGVGAAGAWVATNATTHTVTLPAHAAGDILVVIAACKAATITSVDPTIATSGWARVASFADGTTAAGTGVGSVRQAVFYKVAASGAETNPVVTWGGGQTAAPGIAVGLGFTKGSTDVWVVPWVLQAATNASTGISVTLGSASEIRTDDWGVVAHTTADDSALTSPTWSSSGNTLGTATVYPATPIATTTSNDMAGTAAYRVVTAGDSTAAPNVTATQAAAETGVSSLIRLRVEPGPEPAGTTIYPTATASAVSTASLDLEAWTSRGAGVATAVTNTTTSPGSPITVTDTAGGTVIAWFTRPLTAFTLAGPVRVNLRLAESNLAANVTARISIHRVAGDGTSATAWGLAQAHEPEVSTTEGVLQFLVPGSSMAISNGQRLRVLASIYHVSGNLMVGGHTATLYYGGTSGGASGDTYLTFTETLTEYSAGTPVTGTGAGAGTASTSSGTAAETFIGTGGGTGTAATAVGSGTSLQAFTGTGAGTQVAATASGTGVEAISGTGAGTLHPPAGAGSGTALFAVTGTGAGEQAAASATGEALQVFPGGGVQVPQSGYGEGMVEGGEVEVPVGGSTIYAPRLVVISGGGAGVQARQTARGKGRVNDDDLVLMAA